jgi:hypothetical protein
VWRDGFYFGSSDAYEIGYYSAEGTLLHVIRTGEPNRLVANRDIERYKRAQTKAWRDARQAAERVVEEMPYPEEMPAYGPLRVDEEGNLWVAEYLPLGNEQPSWRVFDTRHRHIANVGMPVGFTPYQIGTDYVLGRWLDDLEVEHVQMYELIKG